MIKKNKPVENMNQTELNEELVRMHLNKKIFYKSIVIYLIGAVICIYINRMDALFAVGLAGIYVSITFWFIPSRRIEQIERRMNKKTNK
ncbi:MAG: hypothetical protein ACRCUP_03030 [Mycoplasmatales bacterium]